MVILKSFQNTRLKVLIFCCRTEGISKSSLVFSNFILFSFAFLKWTHKRFILLLCRGFKVYTYTHLVHNMFVSNVFYTQYLKTPKIKWDWVLFYFYADRTWSWPNWSPCPAQASRLQMSGTCVLTDAVGHSSNSDLICSIIWMCDCSVVQQVNDVVEDKVKNISDALTK